MTEDEEAEEIIRRLKFPPIRTIIYDVNSLYSNTLDDLEYFQKKLYHALSISQAQISNHPTN